MASNLTKAISKLPPSSKQRLLILLEAVGYASRVKGRSTTQSQWRITALGQVLSEEQAQKVVDAWEQVS